MGTMRLIFAVFCMEFFKVRLQSTMTAVTLIHKPSLTAR